MKRKKVLLISGGLLTMIIVISTIFIVNKNSTNNEIVMQDNKKQINNSFLTLMLEQSDGTYQESTSNTWPGEGYIFNKELSSCQNGGELDYDSENNKVILYNNKSDGCYVYFDLYNKPTINSINLGEVTNNSINITVSATNGTNPISNYYYIINDETPVSTTSNTYTFSGLSAGQIYTIKVYAVDTEGFSSDTSSLSVETESIVYLADYIKNTVYQGDGVNGLYYHDGQGSYTNADQEAGDNSYRYAGANPNNYVCFGSTASVCPLDNLYRIIGVFGNEVKLIKYDYPTTNETGTNGAYFNTYSNYLGSSRYYKGSQNMSLVGVYQWNTNGNNTWSTSQLNITNLNNVFLNSLSEVWKNRIVNYTWYVGGYSTQYAIIKEFYNAESYGTTWNGKIGLMYVSDYGYAASPDYWATYIALYSNARSSNWIYMGLPEWTILPYSSQDNAFCTSQSGEVYSCYLNRYGDAIRPCFYLNSDVEYASGSGTESDPIRIKID